ncbi:DUF4974 domain-containing protein [Dyadobacter flavalbus]|uniref:DUF4974 domain-containing protein n=1 Tax=Dyadobacter flavalbus TaxID=2579942 RepID=A0A5M8QS03_9BACT|nr:FecR domain-containing protein [Dyadobacter flavalbus]KAA6438859.1 DUF4974 domain-containing protein [Dyadobacter flavalbus]
MNESHPQITKEMVFAHFAHRSTSMERQQIENWLNTNEGAEAYFTYLDEWERQFPQFQADLDGARADFARLVHGKDECVLIKSNQEISPVNPVSETVRPHWQRIKGFLSAAAASAILIIGIWLAKDLWYYKNMSTRNEQTLSIHLNDGSQVQLGANSSLKYPRFWFGENTRYVWLVGDAEFNVTHLPNAERFIVYTPDQTAIEVLGTKFIVSSRQKFTKVFLKTGSIRLTNPMASKPLMLKPGDQVTVSDEKRIQKETIPHLADEPKSQSRKFMFKNTSLKEVAEQLNNVYGINVRIIQPELLTRTVSGTFQAESTLDLLEAVCEMMELELIQTADGYTLQKPKQ